MFVRSFIQCMFLFHYLLGICFFENYCRLNLDNDHQVMFFNYYRYGLDDIFNSINFPDKLYSTLGKCAREPYEVWGLVTRISPSLPISFYNFIADPSLSVILIFFLFSLSLVFIIFVFSLFHTNRWSQLYYACAGVLTTRKYRPQQSAKIRNSSECSIFSASVPRTKPPYWTNTWYNSKTADSMDNFFCSMRHHARN